MSTTEARALHPALRGDNPYLQQALERGSLQVGWDVRWPPDYSGFERRYCRLELVREFAWAIPNDLALAALAERGPLIEIGAGGGYWAHLLRERGVDILAFDPQLWHKTEYANKADQRIWTDVGEADALVAGEHPDRTLFLCWPSYDEPWAAEGLAAYKGSTVVYVGEAEGGCTGDDDFHAALSREFTEVAEVSIPQWDGLNDYLSVWERR